MRAGRFRRVFTTVLLQKAIELKAKGLGWRDVAERLGVKQNSLEVEASKYKRGLITADSEKRYETNLKIIADVEAGVDIPEISEKYGIPRSIINDRLYHMGYDAEVRREYMRAA